MTTPFDGDIPLPTRARDGARTATEPRNVHPLVLGAFTTARPPHRVDQSRALDWIARVHAGSEATQAGLSADERRAFEARLRKVIDRCACSPAQIASRGHVVDDVGRDDFGDMTIYDVQKNPRGVGTEARTRLFAELVSKYFVDAYADEHVAPSDLIHVTCTGYVSPSGAQRLVANKGWGELTRVTHAYHMGCYAAFPAMRLAAGALSYRSPDGRGAGVDERARVDIVHTELCSLHMDPSDHSLEQLVVQSLFADGFIRYAMHTPGVGPGLRVLSQHEAILPDSAESMSWVGTDAGMKMTLARDVPDRIAGALRRFVDQLYTSARLRPEEQIPGSVFAVHPGGPKIIDRVRDVLELGEPQLRSSRDVLFAYGNMSSATLPHVWKNVLEDDRIPNGKLVLSLAFGPGLTVCGALFRKE
jgi:predicted naringenin-chalcone synthase